MELKKSGRQALAWAKNFLPALKDLFKKDNLKFFVGIILMAGILLAIFVFYQSFIRPDHGVLPVINKLASVNGSAEISGDDHEGKLERRLDGVYVDPGKENLLTVGVMIENHFAAWPQSGLDKASIVYEAVTEGAVSRFLAIYDSAEEVPEIGPVRSARLYYLSWASEWQAAYLHVGGSEEALEEISDYNILDLNEYYNGQYFWRSSRARPHNVYTSLELIKKAQENKKWPMVNNFNPWFFKDDAVAEERGADGGTISFDYSPSKTYLVKWVYNKEKDAYERYQGGDPANQKDGAAIWAKNIVFQYTSHKTLDSVGRQEIKTAGSGQALIFQDGVSKQGTWQKSSEGHQTIFYYVDGREVNFNRGQTWIEVVPVGMEVSY